MTTEKTPAASGLAILVHSRQQIGLGLAVAGVLLAILAIVWMVWGWPTKEGSGNAPTAETKSEEPPALDTFKDKSKRAHSGDYLPAGVWAGILSLLCLGSTVRLLTQPLASGGEITGARIEVLAFGSCVGLTTGLLGLVLGISWSDSLFKWINEDDKTEAKWVLIAASIFTAGLIIMFASLQLARAEERTNFVLRRMLYGFNSVFLGLLLFMVLLVVNVLSFFKVPSTLVTTDSAFTELTEPSKTFLHSLDQPVKVYLMLPEKYQEPVQTRQGVMPYERLYADCRGLLSQCEDQSRNFHAEYLSPGLDSKRIATVLARLNVKVDEREKEPFGMLIAVGENEEAVTFINSGDLIETVPIGRGSEMLVFQGENKLMTELSYLTDKRSKEVIYFTQDNQELTIEAASARSAGGVVQYLREKHLNVQALHLDSKEPKIPDDAAVVVVAGPQTTLAQDSPTMKALREYMRPSTPGARAGKLLAYLPAFPDPTTGKVAPTGLEPLLTQFGVQVSTDRRLVGIPGQHPAGGGRSVPPDIAYCQIPNDLRLSLGKTLSISPLLIKNARPVRGTPGPEFRTHVLLGTPTGAVYWQESDWRTRAQVALQEMANDPTGKLAEEKQLGRASVPVAIAVTQPPPPGPDSKGGEKPRMLVFGGDSPVLDRGDEIAVPLEYRQLVFSDCVDWLREREGGLGIPPRKAPTYTIGKPPDWLSLFTLLAMMLVGIVGAGLGVWLSRRR